MIARGCALTLALLIAAPAVAETAHQVVQDSTDALMQVVSEGRTYVEIEPDRFYTAIGDALALVVDFDGIARSVMAVHYKKATDEQRSRFADVFKWSLVRAYGKALVEFGGSTIDVLPAAKPPRNPRRQSVKMEITTSEGRVYPVVYSMVDLDDGTWRVRNLIINGVNLGLTYRSQFASAMKDARDIDGVIESWGDVVKSVDLDAREPS